MEIRVYDKLLQPVGTIDEIVTLIWKIKYFDVGSFSILAPATPNNIKLLTKGNLITKHNKTPDYTDSDGNVWRRAGQITYVNITKDTKGQEQIEAQGYMLSRWLSKRVVMPQIVMTGTRQQVANTLIAKNCGSQATTARQFPQFTIIEQQDYAGVSTAYSNEVYVDLGLEIKSVAQSGKLGYDILIDERRQLYGFYLYKGNDFTAGNNDGNNPCIFAREFDNVNDQEYETCNENTKNFIVVMGKAAEDETEAPVVTGYTEEAAGLELEEVYCDATSIERNYTDDAGAQQTIPLDTYYSQLETKASTELSGYKETINFTSKINLQSTMRYKEDYDIGDRVTCLDKSWNIKLDARITEITETYQQGKEELTATFGESEPSLLDKIRKVR